MRELRVSNHLPDRFEEKKRGRRGKIVAALVVLSASILPSVLVNVWFLIAGVGVFFILLSSAFSPGSEEKALRAGILGEDVLKE